MAEDLVQPLAAPEAPMAAPSSGGFATGDLVGPPSSGVAQTSSRSEPEKHEVSPQDDDANEEEDLTVATKPQVYRDWIDFIVGINPDRVANAGLKLFDEGLETAFTVSVESFKSLFKGDSATQTASEKGKPSDLPRMAHHGKGNSGHHKV